MLRYFLILMAFGYSAVGYAFTYVPMTDEALLAQTPVVVLGEIGQVSAPEENGRRVTEYQLLVNEVLKGEVASNPILVQTPGSARPSSQVHWIPGLPKFATGETVLLFLKPRTDGSYGIMQLGLGAFHLVRDQQGGLAFARDLRDARPLPVGPPLANALNELPRKANDFLAQLGGQLQLDESNSPDGHQTANFTLLGPDQTPPGPPSRWFEFDQGQQVDFHAHQSGQSGMSGGGFTEFQVAIAAWNNDTGSNIRYRYAGKTGATTGFRDNDGINAILFDDPNVGGNDDPEGDGEVEGSFDCTEGGVLAAGGFVSTNSTSNYNGEQFAAILEADIITNDGAGCFFAGQGGSNGEEIFGHELGHTLGLGHACGEGLLLDDCRTLLGQPTVQNDALMRAFPHVDGRGARLGEDDRNGVAFVYEQSSSSTPPPDDGSDDRITSDPQPGSGGSSSGGGGGCVLKPGAPVDPLLWLMSLSALAWLVRRKAAVCSNK